MSNEKLISILDYSSSNEEEIEDVCKNEILEDSEDEISEGINSLSNILKLHEGYKKTYKKLEFPLSSNIKFRECYEEYRTKQITSISLPKKGQRMICGTLSGDIEIYEFNNMYFNDLVPNKVIYPLENHAVQSVEFNEQGSLFLAACGDSICRVFDSYGNFLTGTVRGDPYVKSAKKNYGHTHMILDCKWDSRNQSCFITSSIDNTIRMFDINSEPYGIDGYLPSCNVMKCLDKRNVNISLVQVNSLDISHLGDYIVSSCTDGSIQIFSRTNNHFSETPTCIIREAHISELGSKSISDVSFIKYQSIGNRYIASRGILDRSVKIWDLRRTDKAVNIVKDLPSDNNENTKLIFSGCNSNLLTSTSIIEKSNDEYFFRSSLVSMEIDNLINTSNACKAESILGLNKGISTFEWCHEINQIILALENGNIIIYYDLNLKNPSNKGILLSLNKKRRKKYEGLYDSSFQAYNVEELPEGFKETKSGEIKYIGVSSKKSKVYAPKHPKIN